MRLFVAYFAAAWIALAASYEIRPGPDTSFVLTVEKTGLMRGKKHLFVFEKYEGVLQFDSQRPVDTTIQLKIDSRRVVCKDDWVSQKDLRKIQETALDDMLASKRFPAISFTSSSITPLGGDRYEAQGTLTIRDIARPVVVTVQLNASNPRLLRLEGTAAVKLTDYKLKPPSAVLGTIGTRDEMTLNFTILAVGIN